MGRGRGRGRGRPRLVPPSTTNPTAAISDQQATEKETIVDDAVRNDSEENGSLAEENEEIVSDTENLGHHITEVRMEGETS
ncbi:unnamed protein product [Lathyrus sativus]|nr:unnamed protein product [Lathyrus sativus]